MTLPVPSQKPPEVYDPEEYRMTIGEHLEDLRRRLIFALIGLFVAVLVLMAIGDKVMVIFCRPYISAARDSHVTPQFVYTQVQEVFMNYLKISLICAAAIASPWMLYQVWLFVAAGLYPRERKMITKYIPLSITLLITGMAFVYFFVLPLTLRFLLEFSSAVPVPTMEHSPTTQVSSEDVSLIKILHGDPEKPVEGQFWFNDLDGRLKFFHNGETRVMPFGPEKLFAPMISVGDYIDLTMITLVTFGLAFQLPLVVLALVRIGIVEISMLRKYRRVIYFVMSIVAAIVAPGGVITAMIALLIPMIILYEMGIILAVWSEKARAKEEAEST